MPISQSEFDQLVPNLGLTPEGQRYVSTVRSSPPSRLVQSDVLPNCRYRFVSTRMGFSVMAESHLEYRFILALEYESDELIEYWDQPLPVEIHGINKSERPFRSAYTADVLAIYRERIIAYEVKPYSVCLELIAKRPHDWLKTERGFEYRPAKEAFARLGIDHLVVTDGDIDPIYSGNCELLLKARSEPHLQTYAFLRERSEQFLEQEGASSIRSLLTHTETSDATPFIQMIDEGILTSKMRLHRFFDIDETWVALNSTTLDKIIEAKSLLDRSIHVGETLPRAASPSSHQLLEMHNRLEQVLGTVECSTSASTLRRWRRHSANGKNVAALVSRKYLRGNRLSRLSHHHDLIVKATLVAKFLTPNSLNPYRCYAAYCGKLVTAAKKNPSDPSLSKPLSFPAFHRRIRLLDPETVARARGGKRAANAAKAPVSPTKRQVLATRPFQRAHIDHAVLKVHLKVMDSGKKVVTLRPWLTMMVDEESGAILATSLSFRSPSRRSCALVMRDCVRRHDCLPETIVVDNGREFDSVYFEACLARLGVNKQSRPPGDPRYGSAVERVFGTLKEEFVLTLPGNTRNIATDRGKSTSHKGQAQATLSLLDMHDLLEHYFFEVYNRHASGNRLLSPTVRMDDGLRLFSMCGIKTNFDYAFLVATAIECEKPIKLDPQRGLRHNGLFYFHPGLRTLPPDSKVEIREEPWDKSCIYALVKNEWIQCLQGPRQQRTTFTAAMICQSVSWLDTTVSRDAAKIGRLIAVDEMNEIVESITERESSPTKSWKSKQCKAPPALPPSKTNIPPLQNQSWEDL
jgi:putative transposase